MKQRKMASSLRGAYFMTACVQACYYPFFVVFLKSRSLDYVQIGSCLGIAALVGALSQPVWGYVADRHLGKRSVLLVLILGSDAAAVLVLLSHSYGTMLISSMLLSVFLPSVATVLDSLCMGISRDGYGIDFNRMRLMNSVGWALCAAFAGIVVNRTAADVSLILLVAFNTMTFVPVCGIRTEEREGNSGTSLSDVSGLLRSRGFTVFILATLLLNITMSTHGNYLAVLIKNTGGSTSIVGIVFGMLSLCEIPTFFFGKRLLVRFHSLALLRVSILCYGLRFLLESLCSAWQPVVLIQVLQFATYALYYVAALHYLSEIVEQRMLTTGFTLHSAVVCGLGGFVGNMLGGYVLQAAGMPVLLRCLSVITLLAWAATWFIEDKRDKNVDYFSQGGKQNVQF